MLNFIESKYMKQLITTALCIAFMSEIAISQQLPVTDEYVLNRYALSPANAGIDKGFDVFTNVRQNWLGVTGAPLTQTIGFNGPLDNGKMGLGGQIMLDQAGIFHQVNASLSYAYIVKINETQALRFGLAAGMLENYIDLSGHSTDLDPALQSQSINTHTFDASFGVGYSYGSLTVGVAIPHLLQTAIKNDANNSVYTVERQYRGYAYKPFALCKSWDVEPIVVVNKTANSALEYEVSGLIRFQKQIWLTAIYRNSGELGVGAGLQYKRLLFNYTLEFGMSGISNASSGGSHDFTLGILLGKNNKRLKDPIFLKHIDGSEPYQKW